MTVAIHSPNPARPWALTLKRASKAEWTKLRTLRSTWRSVAGAVVVSTGLGAALVTSQISQWDSMSARQHQAFDATSTSMIGLLFVAVIIGALAVRSVTAEYTTGMIRSTFVAVPARRTVLLVKAATMAALALPVAVVCGLAGFEIGQPILAQKHLQVTIGHPGVVVAILLGGVAIALTAVIGVGLGALIRRTAGATTVLSLVLVGGALFGTFLPAGFRQYLPEGVIQAALTVHRSAGLLAPGPAVAVLAGYAGVILAVASVRVARRDA
jgi:hypothetical protein